MHPILSGVFSLELRTYLAQKIFSNCRATKNATVDQKSPGLLVGKQKKRIYEKQMNDLFLTVSGQRARPVIRKIFFDKKARPRSQHASSYLDPG